VFTLAQLRGRLFDTVLQHHVQPGQHLLGLLAIGDVHQHVDGTDQLARCVMQRRRVRHDRNARAVGLLDEQLRPSDRPVFPQGYRHGALVMRHRRPVGPEQAPADAPSIGAQIRAATGQIDRCLIVEGDPTLGVGHVDRRG